MTGRRRFPRFLLAAPVDASLRVREEVSIESWSRGEIEAISTTPCPTNEAVTLELAGDGGDRVSVAVRECRPFVTDGGLLRYRLRMTLVQPVGASVPDEGRGQP
jgi:hypothetical protein